MVALAGLWTGASSAADLAAPVLAPASPSYVWSGPYAGAFVGYNFANFDQSIGRGFSGDGFVGGVYSGYNLQSGPIVYGLEGDIGTSALDASGTARLTGATVSADANLFGSLRARAGVAYDPFMVFVTGGLAVENNTLNLQGVEDEKTHLGYTLGAGVEAKVFDNVTSRLEYRYSDFNSKNYDFGNTTTSTGFDEQSIRAGLALKF